MINLYGLIPKKNQKVKYFKMRNDMIQSGAVQVLLLGCGTVM